MCPTMSWLAVTFQFYHNTLKGDSLDNEILMKNSIRVSVRCTLKTTKEPSDVTYNVLVGCYFPLCY